MIACYCRVSSRDQKFDSQRSEIEKWLKGNNIENVHWYEDKESGRTMDRPAFDEMQKAIFNGEVDMLIVWKLDRIARNMKDGLDIIADLCERGIRLVSVTQQIDISGSVGRMVAALLFGAAEIEWEYRRERQAAGISVAKEKGVYKGRKRGSTKARPDRAKELRDKGLSVSEIAAIMNVDKRTVFRYLK